MAKMFYSLDEAARKLGRSVDEVRAMVRSGQISEFRDGDKLVLKREQVDLLSQGTGGETPIGLADSGEISLADSGTSSESTKERSGISIFEGDDSDATVDASAQTQITQSVGGMKVGDAGGSGSGLLDLTRDSADDTGIGAGIMQGVYDDKDGTGAPVGAAATGGALFESTGVASDVGMAAAPMMVLAEQIDGPGSGLAGGLALGMCVSLVAGLLVTLYGLVGFGGGLAGMLTGNWLIVLGALAGLTLVCALVGWVLGRKG